MARGEVVIVTKLIFCSSSSCSPPHQTFQITAALGEVHATRYWIGLTDLFSEGDFFWGQSGTEISPEVRAHWGRGEPNNHGEGEDCVEVRADADGSNAHMNDQGCGDQAEFVCQYRLT